MRLLRVSRRLLIFLWGALCLANPVSVAQAQEFQVRDNFFGVNTGFAAVAAGSRAKSSMKSSMAFKLQAGRQFRENIAAGCELGYNFGHKIEGASAGAVYLGGGQREIFQLTPFVRVSKDYGAKGLPLLPYAIFGLGIYRLPPATVPAEVTSNGVTSYTTVTLPSSTNMGINFGGGINLPVAEGFSISPDLRFHYLLAKGGNILLITPSVGFTVTF